MNNVGIGLWMINVVQISIYSNIILQHFFAKNHKSTNGVVVT